MTAACYNPGIARSHAARLESCAWPGCTAEVETRRPGSGRTYCADHRRQARQISDRRHNRRAAELKGHAAEKADPWHCAPSACPYYLRCLLAILVHARIACQIEDVAYTRLWGDYAKDYTS
jgi:hypothetical protein